MVHLAPPSRRSSPHTNHQAADAACGQTGTEPLAAHDAAVGKGIGVRVQRQHEQEAWGRCRLLTAEASKHQP